MPLDPFELQFASALQRFQGLQRRAEGSREAGALLTKTLAELRSALDQLRVAHDQLVESHTQTEHLQLELRQQSERYWHLLDVMTEAYVVARTDSTILEINRAAAELFNVSQRFLVGKLMSVFVCEARAQFLAASAQAVTAAEPLELSLKLRPRERAPQLVRARVSGRDGILQWVLQPETDRRDL